MESCIDSQTIIEVSLLVYKERYNMLSEKIRL